MYVSQTLETIIAEGTLALAGFHASPLSWWNWNSGEPGEKPSEQGRETTTNSTHIWHRVGIESGTHRWEASALTTAPSLLPMNANVNKFLRNICFTDVENATVNKFLRNIRFTDVEKRHRKQVLTKYAFHRRRENANVNKILRNIRFTDVAKRQR